MKLPVIAEVLIPVEDYPWTLVPHTDGTVDRYYSDDVGPLAETRGIRKTYGLNVERTHVSFKFHDAKDMAAILIFKLKWGRK